jgi:hypothetical protein
MLTKNQIIDKLNETRQKIVSQDNTSLPTKNTELKTHAIDSAFCMIQNCQNNILFPDNFVESLLNFSNVFVA